MAKINTKKVTCDVLVNILFPDVFRAHSNDHSHLDLIVDIFVNRRVQSQVLPRQ